ncbi:hypothetical protein BH09BAC2_BH09BAC2_14630 [soil metagenome]
MLTQGIIKILIVDDDEDDFFIIADYINEIDPAKFIIDWCNSYDIAVEKLKSQQYNIYFVDYRLGNHTGLDLLKEAIRLQCDRPIILLTGKGNKSIDIEAMKSGATDYLVKSELNTEKLERCIRYSMDRAASIRAIKESENKYRNLFSGSKDALFIADSELHLVEVNQAGSNLFGMESESLKTKSFYHFINKEEQKRIIDEALQKNDDLYDMEIELGDDEEKKSCILSILHETTSNNETLIHGVIHDITNLKKAEKAKLETEKLAANERLVRILAHEIRNPLNNIKLSADHLGVITVENEQQKAMIGIIQRSSTRINEMITELLDSTKTIDMVFSKEPLQEIVEESLSVARDRINLQKIKLVKNFSPNSFFINADKSKLEIAFSNIMINAIEAMQYEKGELTINISETNDWYRVMIKDNGKGIAAEHLSKLFEPFFTMKKNGMGLGLSAAYGIFKTHGAIMNVESVVNNGTTFTMDFPGIK